MKNLIRQLFKDRTVEPLVEDSQLIELCKHKWALVAKTYAAPVSSVSEDPRVIFGVTTYTWHCDICGEAKRDEMLGTDENRWDDIIDKVLKFGIQYIKSEDKVFGVAEWVPPIKNG